MASPRILLFGAGKMGGAMLEGWLKDGTPPVDVTVIEPHPSDRMRGLAALGLALSPPPESIGPIDCIVLAIKPQMLDAAAGVLAGIAGPDTLLISVLAGKTIADLKARAPRAGSVVRAMPNTPAAVGRGITGCAASPETTEAQRAFTTRLLSAIGRVEWVDDEALIDAVTAVSGSGPAYVFHMVEALAEAGAEAGLPPDLAMRLARATIEGAGELLFQDADTSAEQLRRNVTSPAGTTAAALDVLMAEDGLRPLMRRAVAAAKRRAGELSG
jgi:pyrroline-5-carboxylate reductase